MCQAEPDLVLAVHGEEVAGAAAGSLGAWLARQWRLEDRGPVLVPETLAAPVVKPVDLPGLLALVSVPATSLLGEPLLAKPLGAQATGSLVWGARLIATMDSPMSETNLPESQG